MQNHYFDTENPLHPYTHSSFANEGTLPPVDALRVQPLIKVGKWPCESKGVWVDIEDHRTREGEYAQNGTPFWLPNFGDRNGSPARYMTGIGPLPVGSVTCEPVGTLLETQVAKRAEINAGFDAAITASLTMPSASTPASAFTVYQAIEVWKAEDPEGYSTLLSIHEARRAALLAAVDAATTPEAVQAITVFYAV